MRRPDSPEDLKLLSLHLENSNALGMAGLRDVTPRKDVTVLMYFFWAEDKAAEKWLEFKGAILETWRKCGLLKTVIVTNALCQCLSDFAGVFDNVEIQVSQLTMCS